MLQFFFYLDVSEEISLFHSVSDGINALRFSSMLWDLLHLSVNQTSCWWKLLVSCIFLLQITNFLSWSHVMHDRAHSEWKQLASQKSEFTLLWHHHIFIYLCMDLFMQLVLCCNYLCEGGKKKKILHKVKCQHEVETECLLTGNFVPEKWIWNFPYGFIEMECNKDPLALQNLGAAFSWSISCVQLGLLLLPQNGMKRLFTDMFVAFFVLFW